MNSTSLTIFLHQKYVQDAKHMLTEETIATPDSHRADLSMTQAILGLVKDVYDTFLRIILHTTGNLDIVIGLKLQLDSYTTAAHHQEDLSHNQTNQYNYDLNNVMVLHLIHQVALGIQLIILRLSSNSMLVANSVVGNNLTMAMFSLYLTMNDVSAPVNHALHCHILKPDQPLH